MSKANRDPSSSVLMVAYHFPPLAGSSGIQRTLRFVQQLSAEGWQPLVLSAHRRAYERTSEDQMGDVPSGVDVRRAQAWDAARHFSLAGRYPGLLARPDRWCSWKFDAVRVGCQMLRESAAGILWSTYPIATAHAIGLALHQRTGLPWVADFRDPMAQPGYPTDPRTWRAFDCMEKAVIRSASACVFVTPGALATYRDRYPAAAARMHLIENGYDEGSFAEAEAAEGSLRNVALNDRCTTLLHSGLLYPSERDPTQLFKAVAQLHAEAVIRPGALKIRFRASSADALLAMLAQRFDVLPYIEIVAPLPYRAALGEMIRADGLLLLQASNCNDQVPAKLYEYVRAKRPILCLSDPAGDTERTLRAMGMSEGFARLDDSDSIANCLRRFLLASPSASQHLVSPKAVAGASRQSRTKQLAQLLTEIIAQHRLARDRKDGDDFRRLDDPQTPPCLGGRNGEEQHAATTQQPDNRLNL